MANVAKINGYDVKDAVARGNIENIQQDLSTAQGYISTLQGDVSDIKADLGEITALETTVKTSAVNAINEVNGKADDNANAVGTLSDLSTTVKTDLVSAINEVDSHADKNTANFASAFSELTSYAVGDYVTYNDVLYRCITAHSAGVWVAAHFTQITIGGDLTALINGLVEHDHNIPRYVNGVLGKDITAYITDGTFWKRLAGTDGYALFEDIYVGDYFRMSRAISAYERTGQYQITGSQCVTIAGLDTMMNNGDQGSGVNYHHAVMVAGQGSGGTQHFGQSRMNATNTTEGGYKASEMNTLVLGDVVSAGSTAADATINQQLYAEFGSHLKTTRELVSNAINATGSNRFGGATGCTSSWEWISVQAILMSEIEVYGSIVWSSSGYDTGNANRQLPLFAFSKQAQNNHSAYWWLKDIASAANFCRVGDFGRSSYSYASTANTDVRPRFVLA